jgi:hypothetical protein
MTRVVSKKASAIEIQRRVEAIKIQLLDGWSRGEIVRDGSKKWNVCERQIDDYYATAKKQINEEYKPHRHLELQKHIARRERFLELVMRKKKTRDLWLALKIDDSLAKLKGLMVDNVLVPMESKRLEIVDEK